MTRLTLCCALLCTLICVQLAAQTPEPPYLKTGKTYTAPPTVTHSSPFYKNIPFTRGTIMYDGVRYENKSLAYDITSDKLVLEDGAYIQVVKNFVNYFVIKEDTLIYKPTAAGGIPSGYYEKIFSSEKISGIARHTKYLKEVMRGTILERAYEPTTRYYVLLPNLSHFRDIRNEKELLNINKDFKKEARAHLRTLALKYRSHPKETLRAYLEFYETRINPAVK